LYSKGFDIFAAANDSRRREDTWTLHTDLTGASAHIDGPSAPHPQGMRIVTLAEFIRCELDQGRTTGTAATPKTAGIAANDP
jgi:hypothetical protein